MRPRTSAVTALLPLVTICLVAGCTTKTQLNSRPKIHSSSGPVTNNAKVLNEPQRYPELEKKIGNYLNEHCKSVYEKSSPREYFGGSYYPNYLFFNHQTSQYETPLSFGNIRITRDDQWLVVVDAIVRCNTEKQGDETLEWQSGICSKHSQFIDTTTPLMFWGICCQMKETLKTNPKPITMVLNLSVDTKYTGTDKYGNPVSPRRIQAGSKFINLADGAKVNWDNIDLARFCDLIEENVMSAEEMENE